MNNKHLLDMMGDIDDKFIKEAAPQENGAKAKRAPNGWRIAAIAAILLLCVSLGSIAITAEAKTYDDAVQFFEAYSMSTEGLTRSEIKQVYKDITTKSFTYSKTAEVIKLNINKETVGGFDIDLEHEPLTPENVEAMWKFWDSWAANKHADGKVYYEHRAEFREEYEPEIGETVKVHERSYLDKYIGEELIWSTEISEFWIWAHTEVSDGVIVEGKTYTWSSNQDQYLWLAKIDNDGNVLWINKVNDGFEHESVKALVENPDGSYAVFSYADYSYFVLRQYSKNGELLYLSQNDIPTPVVVNATSFGDGYLVHFNQSNISHDGDKFAIVDYYGNITESFTYSSEDENYYIEDIIEFNGNIYLSGHSTPKENSVLSYLQENGIWEISSEELTPMLRKRYTAILLVCDSNVGTPKKFYSAEGSLGSKLSIDDNGMLLWNVESIASTFFSPATSSFTFGGKCNVLRYTFDASGILISREYTGESTIFRK